MLGKGCNIDGFKLGFPIKEGSYAETYRVKDETGRNYFLKLFDCAKLQRSQFSSEGNITEIEISKILRHPNFPEYRYSGEILLYGRQMAYMVCDFISGETVAEKIERTQRFSTYEATRIIIGVLNGVKYLHSQGVPIIHNELTVQNVMLDLSKNPACPKIIDFGHARYLDQGRLIFTKDPVNPFYMAPEAFNGIYSVQTDLYMVGAMLYHMLFGLPPYFIDISNCRNDYEALVECVLAEKKRPVRLPDTGKKDSDTVDILQIVSKALSYDVSERFQSADEFIKTINGEIKLNPGSTTKVLTKDNKDTNANRKGNGFSDVAGMTELKEQLKSDVIDLLQNPEQAKMLGLNLPNGLLFYGPPGCGKTYFAEKFAEEIGCNYQYIKCSDVASPYIHGGQGKIAAVFDEARKNAPTILFFDEIDAMIKDRSKHTNVSEAGEVNEFLAQLNNCGQDGVIVIGATNKPTEIDEAALRAGRLEYKYYIPQPDYETRKELFRINLSKRRTDFGIDYDKLARLTENYVSADIRLIVDYAARLIFRRHQDCITMAALEEAMAKIKPSITAEMIRKHEIIRDEFEGRKVETTRKKIGF